MSSRSENIAINDSTKRNQYKMIHYLAIHCSTIIILKGDKTCPVPLSTVPTKNLETTCHFPITFNYNTMSYQI